MPESTPLSERVGEELKALRTLAGLTQRELADAAGLTQPKVFRIEHGRALPSLPELDAWLAATGAAQRRESLAPMLTAAHSPTRVWSTLLVGTDQLQDRARRREEACSLVQAYVPNIVPGLLQTAEYARQLLAQVSPPGADVAAQVAGRIERQQVLYREGHRFAFLIGEPALRWAPGPGVLPAQLDRLASLSTLASVEVGLLPLARSGTPPWHGFAYRVPAEAGESPFVTGELVHGEFTATDPDAVGAYRDLWDRMWNAAITGPEAVAFLRRLGG